jgi:hypothetical protein
VGGDEDGGWGRTRAGAIFFLNVRYCNPTDRVFGMAKKENGKTEGKKESAPVDAIYKVPKHSIREKKEILNGVFLLNFRSLLENYDKV